MSYDLTNYIPMADRPDDFVPLNELNQLMTVALESLAANETTLENIPYITKEMQFIAESLANNVPLKDACLALGIPIIRHVNWIRTNKIYAKAIELIKSAQAEALEDVVWQNALSGTSHTSIERMFALKSRKEEYKENAVIADTGNISIRVTLEGGDIPKEVDVEFSEKGEQND